MTVSLVPVAVGISADWAILWCSTLPVISIVGRQPESAWGTSSSTARCPARSELSVGFVM